MKKDLRVAVIGASGRMGQELAQILGKTDKVSAFLGVVRKGTASGFQHSASGLQSPLLQEADLWIDFSSLDRFSQVVAAAARAKKPLVSGVTGLGVSHRMALKKAGQSIPLLWAPNMSLGVAALKKALAVARDLEGFDFQVEEIHHRHKKDKPSGTALALQEELASQVKTHLPEPIAIRGGGVFGVHKVWMLSEEETLCFEHQALNRAVFAKGAVRAGQWLVKQRPGLYRLDEMLK